MTMNDEDRQGASESGLAQFGEFLDEVESGLAAFTDVENLALIQSLAGGEPDPDLRTDEAQIMSLLSVEDELESKLTELEATRTELHRAKIDLASIRQEVHTTHQRAKDMIDGAWAKAEEIQKGAQNRADIICDSALTQAIELLERAKSEAENLRFTATEFFDAVTIEAVRDYSVTNQPPNSVSGMIINDALASLEIAVQTRDQTAAATALSVLSYAAGDDGHWLLNQLAATGLRLANASASTKPDSRRLTVPHDTSRA